MKMKDGTTHAQTERVSTLITRKGRKIEKEEEDRS
jgi:hypothetical protein